MIEDLRQHLEEAKREKELRESDPNVKLAYDAYKMAVALTREEHDS